MALSNEMKEYLLQHREQLEEQQVEVIPNWYDSKPIENVSKSYLNNKFIDIKPNDNLIVSYFGEYGDLSRLRYNP